MRKMHCEALPDSCFETAHGDERLRMAEPEVLGASQYHTTFRLDKFRQSRDERTVVGRSGYKQPLLERQSKKGWCGGYSDIERR